MSVSVLVSVVVCPGRKGLEIHYGAVRCVIPMWSSCFDILVLRCRYLILCCCCCYCCCWRVGSVLVIRFDPGTVTGSPGFGVWALGGESGIANGGLGSKLCFKEKKHRFGFSGVGV